MHFLDLWALLLFITFALADVSIVSPSAGSSFSGLGGTAQIKLLWLDDSDSSDDDTSLTKVSRYAIVLCTGPNDNIMGVKTITSKLSSTALSYDVNLQSTDVPNGIYFLQVYAQFDGGYTIHYTSRFTLTGMTGQTNTITFATSYLSMTGNIPEPQVMLAGGGATSINSASFTVPYTLQTGTIRYAPMQMQPGTAVTHTMYSTRHVTSAYTPYSSVSPSPNVHSTVTPGWSYTVTSFFNTAAVAEYPTYFYPASERVVQASLSSARQKRWL